MSNVFVMVIAGQLREEEWKRRQTEEAEVLEDGWEYVEDGPAEIIWKGNEIIVNKPRRKVWRGGFSTSKVLEVEPLSIWPSFFTNLVFASKNVSLFKTEIWFRVRTGSSERSLKSIRLPRWCLERVSLDLIWSNSGSK